MPPLNKFLDDQENNVWRYQGPHQDVAKRGSSFGAMSDNPLKVTVEASSTWARRVRFLDEDETFSIIGRGDYTAQEIEDCWCTASEFAGFKRDVYTTVHLKRIDPSRIDEVEYTLRGAEHRTEEGSARRYTLRSRAKSTVLDEQDFQDGIGEADGSLLAEVYARCTSDAVFDALNLAALDQLEAERSHQESVYEDLFNDDWISSISSLDSDSAFTCSGDNSYLDLPGFDDAWLRDLTVEA